MPGEPHIHLFDIMHGTMFERRGFLVGRIYVEPDAVVAPVYQLDNEYGVERLAVERLPRSLVRLDSPMRGTDLHWFAQ